ncbi:MAG: HEAT repeat domain-containing protein [Anaerolineae bacterium]|nr:HEAT repeat domain-containing protein [Anaerolineae bacterium]
MPRGLLFRRIIAGILILLFVAAAIYSAADEFDKPIPLMIAAILGIAVLIEPVSIIWDRFIPDATTRRRKPAANAVRDADAYLEGRLRQFDDESKLFVELAGDTLIQTTFSSEAHQFEDIQKAVELHKGRFVLIGEPGAGKSTTLRQLMIQAIRDYRLRTNPRLPVWINLGLSGTPINGDDLIQFWWDEQAYLPGTPDQHIKNDAVWFFMDGLNEMPLDSREERAQALKSFLDKHPTLPVIVTCRVRDYEDDKKLNLGLPMVRVHELDEGRIQEFIRKRGASAELWDKIRNNDALRRMADNPYKLVMLIAVYQARRELPERLDELYGLYVTEAYRTYKDEREKQANTPLLRLTWPKLETRLKWLAFLMIKDGKGTAASVEWARHKIGKRALMDGINLGVLVVDGEDAKFYHQSLHGFFAVQRLGKALNTEGKSKRQHSNIIALIRQIEDLGEAGSPAVEPLIKALQDSEKWVRYRAAEVLGRIRDTRAVMPLTDALQDTEYQVQWEAARALGKLCDPRAVQPLIRVLAEDNLLQEIAVYSLCEVGEPAVAPLIDALCNPVWRVRKGAAWALGELGDTRAVEPLIKALGDDVERSRYMAAWALGELGDTRAVLPLIELLGDADINIRSSSAKALGELGDTRAVEPLIKALGDTREIVQTAAAGALGEIGDTHAVEPLIKALGHGSSILREVTVWALGQMGESAVEPLIKALGDDDGPVRWSAARALGNISDARAVGPLIKALDDPDHRVYLYAAESLGNIGDARAVESLVAYLSHTNAWLRESAAQALGNIGDIRAIGPLVRLLGDAVDTVRWAAEKALSRIGTPEALAAVEQWERKQK